MFSIRVGGESVEYLVLNVYGREHEGSTDRWDRGWLLCEVEVAAGAFRGTLRGSLQSNELEHFHRRLLALHERLSGSAELHTMEQWIELRVTGDCKGHINLTGRLTDLFASGNTLMFQLALDQTDLAPALRQLAELCRAYPDGE